jgi:hypothetical protein
MPLVSSQEISVELERRRRIFHQNINQSYLNSTPKMNSIYILLLEMISA